MSSNSFKGKLSRLTERRVLSSIGLDYFLSDTRKGLENVVCEENEVEAGTVDSVD